MRVRRRPDPGATRGVDGVDGLRPGHPHRRVRRTAVGGGERTRGTRRRPTDVQPQDAHRRCARARRSASTDQVGMLAKIEAPTLITFGRDDRVTPLDSVLVPMRIDPPLRGPHLPELRALGDDRTQGRVRERGAVVPRPRSDSALTRRRLRVAVDASRAAGARVRDVVAVESRCDLHRRIDPATGHRPVPLEHDDPCRRSATPRRVARAGRRSGPR